MPTGPKTLLFDLDGTLADPYEAFSSSLIHALSEHSYPLPDPKTLRSCIGPPLQESLIQILGVSKEHMPKVLEEYRTHHEKKALEQYKFFPGARPFLEKAKTKYNLYVATSKPWYLAEPILEKQKMDHFFIKIYGAEKDGTRSNKADLLQFLIQKEGLDKASTFMIGDRKHDVLAAIKNGILCYGVGWGFAEENELQKAKANQVFASWKELGDFLLP